jgi:hypothetical protein
MYIIVKKDFYLFLKLESTDERKFRERSEHSIFYPLANEVAKRYTPPKKNPNIKIHI